jgi:hypothetical protein
MNIDKSKVVMTTNKFEQLKIKFRNEYANANNSDYSTIDKNAALFNSLNELLGILSDMVMED